MKKFKLKNSSIHLGDCLQLMHSIPDKSIDMILADLPYGTTNCKWDSIICLTCLWSMYNRITKDEGAIVLTASQPFTTTLINSNLKYFKYSWIWEKSKASNFQLAKKNPLKYHEDIVVFYKKSPLYNQHNLKDCFIKSGRKDTIRNLKHIKGRSDYITTKTGYNKSIIKFNNPSGRGHLHPTQKPVELFEYLIQTYTNKNEIYVAF